VEKLQPAPQKTVRHLPPAEVCPHLRRITRLEGGIVTIDAMGYQHKIAGRIVGRKADYLFLLKGNSIKTIFKNYI
jgi:predicted transposase YbfD/YdcC